LDKLKQGLDNAKKIVEPAKDAAKVAKGIEGIGPEEERVIGESVALEIVGQYGGLVRDEAITRRVNMIGRELAYYSTRPALKWKFGVLDAPSINGFSAPSGYVFITRGLYDLVASSDDDLAAVLAHEIAHVTERHALRIIARDDAVKSGANLLVQYNKNAANAQAQLSPFDVGIGNIVKVLLQQGFDPPTEFAADRVGRQLATTIGYAPGGLRHVLTELQQHTADPKKVFSTHPPLADRIKQLPAE
jgi:beta-barrel assembly-enhancing protease